MDEDGLWTWCAKAVLGNGLPGWDSSCDVEEGDERFEAVCFSWATRDRRRSAKNAKEAETCWKRLYSSQRWASSQTSGRDQASVQDRRAKTWYRAEARSQEEGCSWASWRTPGQDEGGVWPGVQLGGPGCGASMFCICLILPCSFCIFLYLLIHPVAKL